MDPIQLYLSYDADFDLLSAFPLGRTLDRHRHWHGVSEEFGYALEESEGRPVGFQVHRFGSFDPEGLPELFAGPRFDVPVLGLRDTTAGEVCLAAAPFLAGRSTLNRIYFDEAMAHQDDLDRAAQLWSLCLQTGDMMAHYGLGYTLLDLSRAHEAYRHLRAYTEIVPEDSWAWCYRGRAAEAIGDRDGARDAYRRAIELERETGEDTDAPELLEALDDAAEAA